MQDSLRAMVRRMPTICGIATACLLFACCFFITPAQALTTTPTKMNFQGRLTDSSGTTMPDGLYNMKFRLFTVASGGSDVCAKHGGY